MLCVCWLVLVSKPTAGLITLVGTTFANQGRFAACRSESGGIVRGIITTKLALGLIGVVRIQRDKVGQERASHKISKVWVTFMTPLADVGVEG